MLTDLITPEHLEWLGDVEWETDHTEHFLWCAESRNWLVMVKDKQGMWPTFSRGMTKYEASCILEHAIIAKFDALNILIVQKPNGVFYCDGMHTKTGTPRHANPRATRNLALLAAIDALIEREKENVTLAD